LAKKKKVACAKCGLRYSRGQMRCPSCGEKNEHIEERYLSPLSGMSAQDRLFGFVLLGAAALIGLPLLGALFLLGPIGGLRLLLLMACVIPIGLLANGLLFLMGIHPRDFRSRMSEMSPVHLVLFICLVALPVLGLVVAILFGLIGSD
jgi:hypothetical protein